MAGDWPLAESQRAPFLAALGLIAGVVLLAAAGSSAAAAPNADTRGGAGQQTFTPVIQEVLSPPRWFRGIDNRLHIEYELCLINGSPVAATVESIQVRRGGGGELDRLTGDRLLAAISPIGSPADTQTTIPPSSVAVAFIDLTLRDRRHLPKRIFHSTLVRLEPGLPVPSESVETGARVHVHQGPPIRIDAPLSGRGWVAIIGPHRRAVQPVNGRFLNGQRFAIDWNRIDEQDRPSFGDPASFASNPSYGARVLAVGDGKVVEAVDGIPDQPPDSFTPVGFQMADGNFVILRLAPGVYAGYAHLIPGSVAVERGDIVRSGELVGRLGNSGNSNGPHLHFQIMNAPSLLVSDSLPLVLRRFRLRGIVPSLDAFGDAYVNQTPVPFSPVGAGPYRNRGPVGVDILDFP
jgi:murein DD-endopeptidase MepM/ murein hydrolase activator NlpD